MANIAMPQIKAPTVDVAGLLKSPAVGAGAAAALFIGAAFALLQMLGPFGHGGARAEMSLDAAFRAAPPGWREALRPAQGPATPEPDVVRLSERPLAPLAGASFNGPAAPAVRALAGGALPAAPISGFFAPGPGGPLPIIAQDGRTPAQAYARPFTSNGRPKLGIVVGGLGLNARATRQAIETLRPEITLSFVVYAEGLQGWIDMARAHGHEVLLETPLEPLDYPDNDPGPYTLMTDASPPETAKKLEWILSRATGYFGLTNYLGSRFLGDDRAYEALASSLRARGLAFVDDGSAARRGGGLPRATAERVIDDQLSAAAIDQQLLALEAGALQRGQALGSAFAYPITLETVARWANEVEQRGYQLAPASALTTRK
ncbi:divergent polysaccharide deacetylase family protein [Phenylobacterium sp. J426]|uniref:divergent polysaccharide deacetylase family protein n=1 Tax=Phenylobacterium sp. J426 TaxID=2898439 RepID=UPI002150A347|nr:divergent polysaccharide deacetylase family protein [Phenylobacterium sp. J426]MCR5873590.1 divergent polysaccharide deacetylase family protein [Phenylobacterium sp. J426]